MLAKNAIAGKPIFVASGLAIYTHKYKKLK